MNLFLSYKKFELYRERCEEIHNAFEDLPGMKLNGDRISPVKHLVLRNMNASREEDTAVMTEIVERVRHLMAVLLYTCLGYDYCTNLHI